MKNFLIYGSILTAGLLLNSCSFDAPGVDVPSTRNARLQVSIEDIDTGLEAKTRATFETEEGEDNVEDLHLLFFDYSENGSGRFVTDYYVENPQLNTKFDLQIGTGEGAGLSHSDSYSILAFANIDDNGYFENSVEDMIAGITANMSQADVIELWNIILPGGATPTAIPMSALPMSGRTVKMANQDLVELDLTRAVIRIDVQNTIGSDYELTSVSIYGAAKETGLWSTEAIATLDHTGFYYGTDTPQAAISGDAVSGGLYAFENFEGDPVTNAAKTTSIVVGLTPLKNNVVGTMGTPMYYRIDIRPEESAQNLLRNHIYMVSLRGVIAEGAANENAAISDEIDYTINNWDLDDEGMVVTDGQSTMAIPSKFVRFDGAGGTRTYNIFTSGDGTLSITASDLPNEFEVSLNGNTLTVTAQSLAVNASDERTGTVEIGFGGLRGTVTIIQSPDDNRYLNLNHNSLPVFDAAGTSSISSMGIDPMQVSASGNWTARIFNPSGDAANPGFEFENGTDTWVSTVDGTDPFDIVTTGGNTGNTARFSFAVFTLLDEHGNEDPEVRQVLVLSQDSYARLFIDPGYDELPFNMAGLPTSPEFTSSPSRTYEIEVISGTDSSGNIRPWTAELTGPDASHFELVTVNSPTPKVYVTARGTDPDYPGVNLGLERNAVLTIGLAGIDNGAVEGIHYFELPVTQDEFSFNVTLRTGSLTKVPTLGTRVYTKQDIYGVSTGNLKYTKGDKYGVPDTSGYTGTLTQKGAYLNYVEFDVDIPEGLQWNAEITNYSHDTNATQPWKTHKGYVITGASSTSNEIGNQAHDSTLKVGFDKIFYPLVHWPDDPNIPTVTIAVSIEGLTGLSPTVITVEQEPLVANALLKNMMTSSTSNSSAIGHGSIGAVDHDERLRPALNNEYHNNFGANGVVRLKESSMNFGSSNETNWWSILNIYSATSVPNTMRYLHMGSMQYTWTQAAGNAVESWRKNPQTEGFMTLYLDYSMAAINNTVGSALGLGFPHDAYTGRHDDYTFISANDDHRVMKYLINGPFGEVENWDTIDYYVDAASGYITGTMPATMIPIISDGGNPGRVTLAIDPANNISILGDASIFYSYYDYNLSDGNEGRERWRMMENYLAMVVNTALYGTHFSELLLDACTHPLYVVDESGAGPSRTVTKLE